MRCCERVREIAQGAANAGDHVAAAYASQIAAFLELHGCGKSSDTEKVELLREQCSKCGYLTGGE